MSENKVNSDSENQIFKNEEALLLDHDYDGIQELDHPLPSWWLAIFYLSIAFSVVYAGYYMTGIGPTLQDELAVAMNEINSKKPAASEGDLSNEMILTILSDPSQLALGKDVYVGKCAACHGASGEGLIGPNLTDDHWVHGQGAPADVATVIRDGVPEKGMPPWGAILTPEELVQVTAFIRSIHGTNPPNAKGPEGTHHEFTNL